MKGLFCVLLFLTNLGGCSLFSCGGGEGVPPPPGPGPNGPERLYVSRGATPTTAGAVLIYLLPITGSAQQPLASFSGPAKFDPVGMAFDPIGTRALYVANGGPNGNNEVDIYPQPLKQGSVPSVILGSLTSAQDVAPTTSGGLFVADASSIKVFEPPIPSGTQPFSITSGISGLPRGLALDQREDLFVSDSSSPPLIEYLPPFSASSTAHLTFGGGNTRGARFSSTQDLYVASDSGVDAYSPGVNTALFTIAVSGGTANGLAFDSSGNMYVAATTTDGGAIYVYKPPFGNSTPVAFVVLIAGATSANGVAVGP